MNSVPMWTPTEVIKLSEPYCAVCRRTVTPDGEHVEVTVVTDPKEKPHGTTYYFHKNCFEEPNWEGPA